MQRKTNPYLVFQVPVLWNISKNWHYWWLSIVHFTHSNLALRRVALQRTLVPSLATWYLQLPWQPRAVPGAVVQTPPRSLVLPGCTVLAGRALRCKVRCTFQLSGSQNFIKGISDTLYMHLLTGNSQATAFHCMSSYALSRLSMLVCLKPRRVPLHSQSICTLCLSVQFSVALVYYRFWSHRWLIFPFHYELPCPI